MSETKHPTRQEVEQNLDGDWPGNWPTMREFHRELCRAHLEALDVVEAARFVKASMQKNSDGFPIRRSVDILLRTLDAFDGKKEWG